MLDGLLCLFVHYVVLLSKDVCIHVCVTKLPSLKASEENALLLSVHPFIHRMFKISDHAYWLDPAALVASNYVHSHIAPRHMPWGACGITADQNTAALPSKPPADSVTNPNVRVRKRKSAASDALDAKYPDNIRHRAIIDHLQAAHVPFFQWWQQQQQQQVEPPQQLLPQASSQPQSQQPSQQPSQQQQQDPQQTSDYCNVDGSHSHPVSSRPPVDWIALAASSHQHLYLSRYNMCTPHPTVTQALPAVTAGAQPHTGATHTAQFAHTAASKVVTPSPLPSSTQACAKHRIPSPSCTQAEQLMPCAQPAFDHVHSNTCRQEVLVRTAASLSLLPPASRFLMSDISRISTLVKGEWDMHVPRYSRILRTRASVYICGDSLGVLLCSQLAARLVCSV